ncbi:MAG: prepilin-type N-terminal cleavage/methylation domain-containing protein [Opitutaceae bacterium]|jgi:prepilin-type N-terminal cleavage/methylation domain-containing protein|nr:prepilin-type N-terminal cleavage/methylation domain-containing protein [Opitutaceae bacterium]
MNLPSLKSSSSPDAFRAFTLVELLTVIAIIGILAAIIITGISKVRSAAWRTQSLSNVRSSVTTVLLYANDNKDALPDKNDSLDGGGGTFVDRNLTNPYKAWTDPSWFCPLVRRAQISRGSVVPADAKDDWVGRIRYNPFLTTNAAGSPYYPSWKNRTGRMYPIRITTIATPSRAMVYSNSDSGGRSGYPDGSAAVGFADGSVKRIPDVSYLGSSSDSNVIKTWRTLDPSTGCLRGYDF